MKCLFKKVFSIEGNIGAGKSTLLSLLEKNFPEATILNEPLLDWKNVGGEDLLKCFYKDPKRWCFTFELYSMMTKIKRLKTALQSDAEIIFMERSLYSDRAFHHVGYFLDKLDTKEASILQEIYDEYMKDYPLLNGVIYVHTPYEVCWERIKKRGRKEEQGINLDYLKRLENQFIATNYGCTMVSIDGVYDLKSPSHILDSIKKFIKK